MNEAVTRHTRWRFPGLGWLVAALVAALVAMLLYPVFNADREGVPQVVRDTAAIHAALREYRSKFGALPAGDSQAISRALMGANPNSIIFIDLRDRSQRGALIDPWGTPYQIHYSADAVLVRSAGRNKRFDESSDRGFDDFIR